MAEINSLSEDFNSIENKPLFDSKIYLSDREDEETIRKTKSLDFRSITTPFTNSTPSSLIGRVEKKETDAEVLSPKEQLLAMDPEELLAIEKELVELKNNPAEPNYLIRVQMLIGKILAQFIRISEKERVQKEDQKEKYNTSNKEWGNLQREVGDRGLNFTWIALGLMVSQFLLPQNDQAIVSFLADRGCKNLSDMFNTETQSKQRQVEGISQLAMAEINAMMNKGSSDASTKQEFINLLDKIYESLKRAAQAG